jgi:hypothetical protein
MFPLSHHTHPCYQRLINGIKLLDISPPPELSLTALHSLIFRAKASVVKSHCLQADNNLSCHKALLHIFQ